MNKRIITNFSKLNSTIKNAIQLQYPHGIEMHLSKMKHLIKGYFFEGFVFEYDNTTYLIEWSKLNDENKFMVYNEDEIDNVLESGLENTDLK